MDIPPDIVKSLTVRLRNMDQPQLRATGFRSPSTLISAYNFAHVPSDAHDGPKAGVLFSALAVEAFLNDLAEFLDKPHSWGDERVDALAEILPELEKERAQIKTKVQLTYFILTGKRIGKGHDPYQSYSLLVDLRNRIVHGRPAVMQFVNRVAQAMPNDQKFVERLIAAGAGDESYAKGPDWEAIAWNPKCAIWAHNTAFNMILHIVDAFPTENLRHTFRVLLRVEEPKHKF